MMPDENETAEILLVVDDPTHRVTLQNALSQSQYRLEVATSANDAFEYLLDHEPALIVIDIQSSEAARIEAASVIRKSQHVPEVPMLFVVNTRNQGAFAEEDIGRGLADTLLNPLDPALLRSKVAVFAKLSETAKRLKKAEALIRESAAIERQRREHQIEMKALLQERAEQKKYQGLVDGMGHGIVWSSDPDSLAVTFVSPSVERILGLSPRDCLSGRNFLLRYIHDEDRRAFLESVEQAMLTGQEIGIEHRFVRSDGGEVWLHSGIRCVKHPDETRQLCGLSIDISSIKRAEEAMRHHKNRSDFLAQAGLLLSESLDYETTLARLGSIAVPRLADWYAIHLLDEDPSRIRLLTLEHADPLKKERVAQFAQQFPIGSDSKVGISQSVREGKALLYSNITEDLLARRAGSKEHLQLLMELGLKSIIVVPLFVRKKALGTMTLVSTQEKRRYDEIDLLMAEDLARRASAAIDNAILYKETQEAVHTRDEFLSIASHELKTPLTPLKIQTQAMMRLLRSGSLGEISQSKLDTMLEISDRQLSRLSKLIDDLLDISRMRIGKFHLTLESSNFSKHIRDIIARFSDQLASSKCTLHITAPEEIMVHWDLFRMEQVVINLLTNAMKYGSEKPILVMIEQVGHGVRITFEDQGIGIAKVDQQRIFERFERAVSNNHFSGLGLGLYITAQIVEAHGGTISVVSDLGKGSKFVAELPRIVDTSRALPSAWTA